MPINNSLDRIRARGILTLLDQYGIEHPEVITQATEHKAQLNQLAIDAHAAPARIAEAIESGTKPKPDDVALAVVAISGKAQAWHDADPVADAAFQHLDTIRTLVHQHIEKDAAELVQLGAKPHLKDLDNLAAADVSNFTSAQFTDYARARQLVEHLDLTWRDSLLTGHRTQDRVKIPAEVVARTANMDLHTSTLWTSARNGWPLVVRTSAEQDKARAAERQATTDYFDQQRASRERAAFTGA